MLRVGHQNVYHLHNKFLDLSVFLNQSAPSYNLFGVTESRLDFRISDQDVNIPDYRIQRKDSTAVGQTGIAVYIHDSIADFTGLVLLTSFLQEMLSLALPCILITFLKAVSFSKFPMHC